MSEWEIGGYIRMIAKLDPHRLFGVKTRRRRVSYLGRGGAKIGGSTSTVDGGGEALVHG